MRSIVAALILCVGLILPGSVPAVGEDGPSTQTLMRGNVQLAAGSSVTMLYDLEQPGRVDILVSPANAVRAFPDVYVAFVQTVPAGGTKIDGRLGPIANMIGGTLYLPAGQYELRLFHNEPNGHLAPVAVWLTYTPS